MSAPTATAAGASGDAPHRNTLTSPTAVVAAASLPPKLAALVLGVTGKCRLWKRERTDVARELCAHFGDGLEAGASATELAESFGDPTDSARLITRARKRLRPLWWRALRRSVQTAAGILLLAMLTYAVLAARLYLGEPTIRRNHSAEMNAPILARPEADRAWPLYIRAIREMGPTPEFRLSSNPPPPEKPGDANWDLLRNYLDTQSVALATVREAAARPVIGIVYRSTMDPEHARALEVRTPEYTYDEALDPPIDNPLIFGVLLPHLGELRNLTRLLIADMYVALEKPDRARYLADLNALFGMSRQCLNEDFLISNLVGLAIAQRAFQALQPALEAPSFLAAEDLTRVAHQIAALGGGRVRLNPRDEERTFDDILQRFFTDDGHGDGRYIESPEADRVYSDFGIVSPSDVDNLGLIKPIRIALTPSRKHIAALVDRYIEACARDEVLPPWRHHERTSNIAYAELLDSGIDTVFPLLKALAGNPDESGFATACKTRDAFETHRDTLLTVLAMELYRRDNSGSYPPSLEALVPRYLPAVPLDPMTGTPLRFRPAPADTGRPIVYSVGSDGVDDGGVAPPTDAGTVGAKNLYWLGKFRSTTPPTTPPTAAELQQMDQVRGDWILWPQPPNP